MLESARRLAWGLTCGWLLAAAGAVRAEPASAVATTKPLASYYRQAWTSRDGLPHNLISEAVQTADGYLWFSTWEGTARYNGHEFVVFDRERVPGLPDTGVRAMATSRDGTLWLGTSRGGVARLREGQWSFIGLAQGLAQLEIMDLAVAADGALWVATESAGLDRVAVDGSVRHYPQRDGLPSDVTYAIAPDPEDPQVAWVGTAGGLARVDGERVRAFGDDRGLPRSEVFSLHLDQRNRLLLGTDRGAFEYDGERFRRVAPAMPEDPVQRVFRDRSGAIWIGTINHGVFRLSELGLERIGTELGMPNARVSSIFEDRERSIWIGTNGGLFRLRDAPFSTLGREHGLSDSYVRSLLEDEAGRLWVGTSSGLDRVDSDGAVVPIGKQGEWPVASVLSMERSARGLWIGSYANGVLHWNGERIDRRIGSEDGLPSNQVRALKQSRDGSLWVGTNRGLLRYRDGVATAFGRAQGLPREFIISLHEDRRGRLWVGTANGLARIVDDRVEVIDTRQLDDAQDVFGFAEDADGTLWAATDRGLARVRDDGVRALGRAEGLPVDTVFQVVSDRVGSLWLSSNRGVMRLQREQALAVADGRQPRLEVELYGELDGMASAQCNGGSGPVALLRRDGRIAVGTAGGVAQVQPETLDQYARLFPPMVIEELRVDDVAYPVEQQPLVLPAGTRRIELHYAGLSYLMPEKIAYRYQLEGFDQGWIDRGNRRVAQFTNLAPGDYRFRVAAANTNGAWSQVEGSLRFTIPPFLWQRREFWVALGAVSVLALAGIYRLRVARLQRAARQLRELVDLRTADLRLQTERLLQADAEKSHLLAEIKAQSEAFERQASEDALTGLANRRAFDDVLAREFARAQRHGAALSLALLDIDWFKRINDGYSHAAGDAALRAVGTVLRRECRAIDSAARYGGEEFVLLLPDTPLAEARTVCERIRAAIAAIDTQGFAPGLAMSASFGVAEAAGLSHYERLVSRADAELYHAKQQGRNRVCG